jgi:uncharacterized damage-inducible protein DinB
MNHDAIVEQWGYFSKVLNVTRKLLEQFPDDGLQFRPTDGVRSTAEVVAHTYTMITDAVDTVAQGKLVQTPAETPPFHDKAGMLRWTDAQVERGIAQFNTLTQAQMEAMIDAWSELFPAWQMLDFTYQEHLHHRGQLTVYLRLMGIQPHSIYDF